ncbi:MAG: hypothetical protein IJ868_04735, partial [Prevotella sp.]|nr:hypothetical protein [Prevotella sp.]
MHTRNNLSILLAMFLFALTVGCNRTSADYHLDYTVSPDTAGHYLNVCLTYQADSTQPNRSDVVLTMPRWAPGYYEMLDFAKHLTDFSAHDAQGQALTWTKEGLNRWRVALPENGRMEVRYRVYANQRDVASSRV